MSNRLTKLLMTSLCLAAIGWAGVTAITSGASAEERYVVIGGAPVDAYWNVVRRGAIEAGNDLNVSVDYLPQDADYVASTVRFVQTVLAQKPNGLATSRSRLRRIARSPLRRYRQRNSCGRSG